MSTFTYYFIGLLTGVSLTAFFIGKELYIEYTKSEIQQNQLNRILKINDEVNKFKILNSLNAQNLSIAVLVKFCLGYQVRNTT